MSPEEMSVTFDVLYNNITSGQAPGVDEFEKSVFLTKGQNQLVVETFNNRVDVTGGGFDGSEKRQYDFSSLIKTSAIYDVESTITLRPTPSPGPEIPDNTPIPTPAPTKLDYRSKIFTFPSDYFLTVNEVVIADDDNKSQLSVIPISHYEYQRLMRKPYQLPPKRSAWRLITDTVSADKTPRIEVICKPDIYSYVLRYIPKLTPIILENISPLTIEGISAQTACKLPPECHQEIVERAVTLAKLAWQGGTQTIANMQQAAARQRNNN